MAINVQSRSGKFQLRVTHALLPRPFFHTFDDEAAAKAYGGQLHGLLERGVVPQELLMPAKGAGPGRREDPLVIELVRDYTKRGPLTESDDQLLTVILGEVVGLRVSAITHRWVDDYVAGLKVLTRTPGTIRKRIGALGRVMDWYLRQHPTLTLANPFRTMPQGYSAYARDSENAVYDESRDRRLEAKEEAAILAALAGEKRVDRERAWGPDEEFEDLYRLIVDAGLRLSEAYKLEASSLNVADRLLHVDGSKGARGARRPRTVPLSTAMTRRLAKRCEGRTGLVFSFWDGAVDAKSRRNTSAKLSARFRTLFAYAGVVDLTEHDLRHESTCRWVTMRAPGGGWLFSEIEICKIMGWSDPRMMLRYASLRGTDLSSRLA